MEGMPRFPFVIKAREYRKICWRRFLSHSGALNATGTVIVEEWDSGCRSRDGQFISIMGRSLRGMRIPVSKCFSFYLLSSANQSGGSVRVSDERRRSGLNWELNWVERPESSKGVVRTGRP